MTVETALRKRKAKYAGETGLFAESEMADEDLSEIPDGEWVWVQARTSANMKLHKFLWALAGKLAKGGLFPDKEIALDQLRIAAKFARFGKDTKGRMIIVPRSISNVSGTTLSRLVDRIVYIVCTDLLPKMKEGDLRAEVEKMLEGKQHGST